MKSIIEFEWNGKNVKMEVVEPLNFNILNMHIDPLWYKNQWYIGNPALKRIA